MTAGWRILMMSGLWERIVMDWYNWVFVGVLAFEGETFFAEWSFVCQEVLPAKRDFVKNLATWLLGYPNFRYIIKEIWMNGTLLKRILKDCVVLPDRCPRIGKISSIVESLPFPPLQPTHEALVCLTRPQTSKPLQTCARRLHWAALVAESSHNPVRRNKQGVLIYAYHVCASLTVLSYWRSSVPERLRRAWTSTKSLSRRLRIARKNFILRLPDWRCLIAGWCVFRFPRFFSTNALFPNLLTSFAIGGDQWPSKSPGRSYWQSGYASDDMSIKLLNPSR